MEVIEPSLPNGGSFHLKYEWKNGVTFHSSWGNLDKVLQWQQRLKGGGKVEISKDHKEQFAMLLFFEDNYDSSFWMFGDDLDALKEFGNFLSSSTLNNH
jgi:hypothetical protein